MKDVQDTLSKYANQERFEPPPFRLEDRVYVRTDHIRTNRTFRQLAEKKIGPFLIISQPSVMSLSPFAFTLLSRFTTGTGRPQYLPSLRAASPSYAHRRRKARILNPTNYRLGVQPHPTPMPTVVPRQWADYPISNNPSDWILASAYRRGSSLALITISTI